MENKTIIISAVGGAIGVTVAILIIMAVAQMDKKIEEAFAPTPEEILLQKCSNMQSYYNSYQELQGYDMKCDKLVDAILN
jgi:ABC-type lipoprotein release transport system permease subunit